MGIPLQALFVAQKTQEQIGEAKSSNKWESFLQLSRSILISWRNLKLILNKGVKCLGYVRIPLPQFQPILL